MVDYNDFNPFSGTDNTTGTGNGANTGTGSYWDDPSVTNMSDTYGADYVEAAQAYTDGYDAGYANANQQNAAHTANTGYNAHNGYHAHNAGNGYHAHNVNTGHNAGNGYQNNGYQNNAQGGNTPRVDEYGNTFYTNMGGNASTGSPNGYKVYDSTSVGVFPIGESASKLRFRIGPVMYQPRSKLIALLLAFFLGPFGAHDFYMGKTSKGIIMLLLWTVGCLIGIGPIIGAVWLIIDLIGIAVSTPTGPMQSYAYDGRGVPMTWLP